MRDLVLLRGAPASGKSTWIQNNNLSQYTLSADAIRLMLQSPVMTIDGTQVISQINDGKVWDFLFTTLDTRMERGELTIIDATHAKVSMINRYKKFTQDYRYRAYVVDFFDGVPLEVCLERNANRDYKSVPPDVIENAYARYKTQPTPNWVTKMLPDEFQSYFGEVNLFDFSNYPRIHHFGDIHGCYTALKTYFDQYPYSEQDYYIFTGDYFERGMEDLETFMFLFDLQSKPNVYFMEGNHEPKLWLWSNNALPPHKMVQRTEDQFAGLDKSSLRQFYRKLGQLAWYRYGDKKVLVTHGGIPVLPSHFTPTDDYIRGVGKYEDIARVTEVWNTTTPVDCFQIHSHRNPLDAPTQSERCYNLEGHIEFGGHLRVVQLDAQGFHSVEIKNDVFDEALVARYNRVTTIQPTTSVTVEALRTDKFIKESPQFGNVSSFNFTRAAFNQKAWTPQTVRARGLYVNVNTGQIAARSYNKFFAVGENSATSLGELYKNLKYPLVAYVKVNGYLGITGHDAESDTLVIASKSTIFGPHADWLSNILSSTVNLPILGDLIIGNNLSFVFEVIEPEQDPHIIKYHDRQAILLDGIVRDYSGAKVTFEQLGTYATTLGVKTKTLAYTFDEWQTFRDWYEILDTDFEYKLDSEYVEGFVLEDPSGFMFRTKTKYYKFWKQMRGVLQSLSKGHTLNTSQFYTPLHNEVYAFMQKLGRDKLGQLNIIQIREMFYQT